MLTPQKAQAIWLPSVDEVVRAEACRVAIAQFGRQATLSATRQTLAGLRALGAEGHRAPVTTDAIIAALTERLEREAVPHLKRVFNLTGTVLHTNLGRAMLAEEAIAAAVTAMR